MKSKLTIPIIPALILLSFLSIFLVHMIKSRQSDENYCYLRQENTVIVMRIGRARLREQCHQAAFPFLYEKPLSYVLNMMK